MQQCNMDMEDLAQLFPDWHQELQCKRQIDRQRGREELTDRKGETNRLGESKIYTLYHSIITRENSDDSRKQKDYIRKQTHNEGMYLCSTQVFMLKNFIVQLNVEEETESMN